jgi:PAS domain S-box-containing protein
MTALSAPQSLRLLEQEKFDAIISDYQMPGMDGIQFLVEVRNRFGQVPFILFTGKGREEVVIQAINSGADFYLQKGGGALAQFTELGHKIRQAVQQRQSEASIRDHERLEADIINFLPDATFAIDTNGFVIAWNRAMEEMTGVSASEMLGKGNYEYSIPIYHERRPVLIDMVLHDHPSIAAKYRALKRDGRTLVAEETTFNLYKGRGATIWFTAAPLYNSRGEIVGAIESIRDISDRKMNEDKIRKSSERYKSLITVSNTGAWGYHRDRDHLWCSPEYLSMLGRDAGQVDLSGVPNLKETWVDLLHPDDRDRAVEHFTKYLDDGSPGIYENYFRMQHADGHWVWIWSRGWTLRDLSGALTDETIGTHIDITKSKLADEDLNVNIERLHMAQEIGQTGSWELNLATGNIWASQEAFRIFAVPRPDNEIISIGEVEDRIPEKDRVHRALLDLIENGAEYNLEYSIEPADNSGLKIVHSVAQVLCGADKKPARVVGVIHDVTARKRAEEALRESEEFNRSLVENIPDYLLIYDQNGTILYTNPSFTKKFGFTQEEVINSPIIGHIAPEYREKISTMMTKRLSDMTIPPYEVSILKKDGSPVPVIVKGTHIIFRKGGAILVLMNDISVHKRMETGLRESEEKYRSLAEQVHDGIYIYQDDCFHFINTHFSEITGYSQEELLTMPFTELIHPDDRAFIRDITGRGWLGEPTPHTYEFRIIRKDETIRYVEVAVSAIPFRGGYAALGAARDISGRRRAEDALRQANQNLTLLSGITRHDINNQLTVLKGYLSLLKEEKPDLSDNEFFQKVVTAAQCISSMIQFTKEYEEIGVHTPVWQITRTLVDTAAKQAPLGHLIVKNDLPPGVEILADPFLVKVFYNLMDNAVRHGGNITAIRVSSQESGDNHLIVCEDDGRGIPADEKERVFERGFGKNTGLGLALSREVLSITGITIRENGVPGNGARFEMMVPKSMWRSTGNEK